MKVTLVRGSRLRHHHGAARLQIAICLAGLSSCEWSGKSQVLFSNTDEF